MKGSSKPIGVVIVDDHPLFRAGLEKVLGFDDQITLLGTSADGENALVQIAELKPDVVLMDVNLPGMNGLQVARQLKSAHEQLAIIILTAHHDSEQILHAMKTGASAYCAKDIHADKLLEVIRLVANGHFVINEEKMTQEERDSWLEEQIEDSTGPYTIDAEGHYIPLSAREMEILEQVTLGLINKEIAAKLGISQQTVKNHMTSILKKLNVKDRTQAAVTALRRGWVRVDNDSQQEA